MHTPGPFGSRAWAEWLKFVPSRVETTNVHFERLAIEAGETTFSVSFHDALTVIAGVGRLEREGLITELISSLGPGRAGVHVELRSDAGNRYAIFRPAGSLHCVVDVDGSEDVTDAFRARDGRINLLDRAGLTLPAAKRAMRIDATDLTTDARTDDWMVRLAHIDPGRLWDVARKCKDREARLGRAAAAAGSTPEDLELYEEIERCHRELEAAEATNERVRQRLFLAAAVLAIVAVPAIALLGPLMTVPLVLVTAALAFHASGYIRREQEARRAEDAALEAAGEHSYLTYQINRVNGLLASDHQRREMVQAAEDHRAASAEWHVLVGDVPIDWAIERRHEIEQAHSRLRESVNNHNPMALSLSPSQVTAAEVSAQLGHRLEQTRRLGAGQESMPTLLDEPFGDLPAPAKLELLQYLLDAAQRQQIILLTDDPDVAEWARVEAILGSLSLIEPTDEQARAGQRPGRPNGERVEMGAGEDHVVTNIKRRSRHVAA